MDIEINIDLKNKSQFLGNIGESKICFKLECLNLFFRKGYILRNVYILKENGETTEIDVIFVTRKGLFVFESKYYSGIIKGNVEDLNWDVEYKKGQKYSLYNPIKQNNMHIQSLKRIVGNEIPIYSVIVFSDKCRVNIKGEIPPFVIMTNLYNLKKNFKFVWKNNKKVLTKKELKELYSKLLSYSLVDKGTKEKHIQDIQKYKDIESKEKIENKRICPRCGNPLVLRKSNRGEFYGCSKFPDCRYTESV